MTDSLWRKRQEPEALKLALEALKSISEMFDYEGNGFKLEYEIKALEEALAKQEQGEPVAIIHRNEYNEYRLEPHDNFDIKSIPFNVDVPLYTTPQQRKPLTDEKIWDLHIKMSAALNCKLSDLIELTRAVEAAHGIKE
jgi:hypothetical protein